MQRDAFLRLVQAYVESDPEVAPHVARFVEAGLSTALSLSMERASDMEAALAMVCAKRINKPLTFVDNIIGKWKGRTALNWDWFLNRDS